MGKILLAVLCLLSIPGFAYPESVQFIATVPSPLGYFDRVQIVPRAVTGQTPAPPCTAPAHIGTIFYRAGTGLQVCEDDGMNNIDWRGLGSGASSVWQQSAPGANVTLVDPTPNKRVVVGTTWLDENGTITSTGAGNIAFVWDPVAASLRAGAGSTAANETITLGFSNTTTGQYATVSGGFTNTAGQNATVSGGTNNTASGQFSFIGGGTGNSSEALRSIVIGGENNHATATSSTILGGYDNVVDGSESVIIGSRMTVTRPAKQSFVWGYSGTGIQTNFTNSKTFFIYGDDGEASVVIGSNTNPLGHRLYVNGPIGGTLDRVNDGELKVQYVPDGDPARAGYYAVYAP